MYVQGGQKKHRAYLSQHWKHFHFLWVGAAPKDHASLQIVCVMQISPSYRPDISGCYIHVWLQFHLQGVIGVIEHLHKVILESHMVCNKIWHIEIQKVSIPSIGLSIHLKTCAVWYRLVYIPLWSCCGIQKHILFMQINTVLMHAFSVH
jgi:hypothetical protein